MAVVQERVGWPRLWDRALDYGVQHTKGLQALSRLMSSHGRGKQPCPLCDHTCLDSPVLDHFLKVHDQQWNMEDLFRLDVSEVARFSISCLRLLHDLKFFNHFYALINFHTPVYSIGNFAINSYDSGYDYTTSYYNILCLTVSHVSMFHMYFDSAACGRSLIEIEIVHDIFRISCLSSSPDAVAHKRWGAWK